MLMFWWEGSKILPSASGLLRMKVKVMTRKMGVMCLCQGQEFHVIKNVWEQITCVECERMGIKTRMHVEKTGTGRKSCHEHTKAFEARGRNSSILWEHVRDYHGSYHNVGFQYDTLSTHQEDSL